MFLLVEEQCYRRGICLKPHLQPGRLWSFAGSRNCHASHTTAKVIDLRSSLRIFDNCRQTYPNVRCFAFSPPGCVISECGIPETQLHVMSVIVGDDFIPQINIQVFNVYSLF